MKNWIQRTVAGMLMIGGIAPALYGQSRPQLPARTVHYASPGPTTNYHTAELPGGGGGLPGGGLPGGGHQRNDAYQSNAYQNNGGDGIVWSDTGLVVNSSGVVGAPAAACACQAGQSGSPVGGRCAQCSGASAGNAPVYMPSPPQQTGVTSGACQPCISGVDCANPTTGEGRWSDATSVHFQPLLHGEYIGPVRLPSMVEYRVRSNDEITFTYIPTRQRSTQDYRLMVGDVIQVSSISEESLKRENVIVQPDGKVYLPALKEPIVAYGKTIQQLRVELETAYKGYFKIPAIDIEPEEVNRALIDLLDSVNGPFAAGGRAFPTTVNPDGRVQLPVLGGVYVLGMSLDEIKREVNLRYQGKVTGIEVEPRLTRMAPHFFHVSGQVNAPGRFEMLGPTTVTAGLAQAGGISLGGNGRQVVIFRRADDWRLVSTVLDLRGAHLGKRPNPSDEIWLRDSDLIIVPERPITRANQAIQQIFTDGIYRVIPFSIQN